MLKKISIVFFEGVGHTNLNCDFHSKKEKENSIIKSVFKLMRFDFSKEFLTPIIEEKISIIKILKEVAKKKKSCEVLISIRNLLIIGNSRVLRI